MARKDDKDKRSPKRLSKDARAKIERGLYTKIGIERERDLIRRTIGEIFRLKHFRPGSYIDSAAIYRRLGGEAEFTARMFADTFGSRELEREGILGDQEADEPNEEIKAALATVAQRLAREEVVGVIGGIAAPVDKVSPGVAETDYACIRFGAAAAIPVVPEEITTWAFLGV